MVFALTPASSSSSSYTTGDWVRFGMRGRKKRQTTLSEIMENKLRRLRLGTNGKLNSPYFFVYVVGTYIYEFNRTVGRLLGDNCR